MKDVEADVLVVGSGIAGLAFSLRASRYADVLMVTKKDRADSNTNYAQGGIAAVFDPEDSYEDHRRDTVLAGAGLCHPDSVDRLVREGPERVRELIAWGVEFSRRDGELDLAREGGHSHRRILHSADLTGREIEESLLRAVSEEERIRTAEDHFVWSLTASHGPAGGRRRCTGAVVLDVQEGEFLRVRSRAVMLAAGGCGRVYRHTTNPAIATGDGVALAWQVGAAVANLEFMQFHPTALYPAGSHAFLISEAVRGEGAVLRRRDGERFMERYHPSGSLAPRDVVARAIHAEMREAGDDHVLLDLDPLPDGCLEERFPNIRRRCAEEGLDLPAQPIPVVPAAHYQCGGAYTDAGGRTTLRGLYAAGETACTGVHGANRLASNSLLEAVVYAARASRSVRRELADLPPPRSGGPEEEPAMERPGTDPDEVGDRVRELMWEDVGIVRSDEGLTRARRGLAELSEEPLARDGSPTGAMEARETAFTLRLARLMVRAAGRREESRGLHYTQSHPYRDSENYLHDTVLAP
ncbi:MAG: L-aspartate oxidase [Candidatus Palauibacterales bacterium]|nr:L-aspartate oxidase [Candidatus Palauibacterales bacterium]